MKVEQLREVEYLIKKRRDILLQVQDLKSYSDKRGQKSTTNVIAKYTFLEYDASFKSEAEGLSISVETTIVIKEITDILSKNLQEVEKDLVTLGVTL